MPTSKLTFQEAERAQLSFLAPIEKRCLIWLARRAPRWMHSDHLTGLGFASLLAGRVCYWYLRRNTAAIFVGSFGLAGNWAGDKLGRARGGAPGKQAPA